MIINCEYLIDKNLPALAANFIYENKLNLKYGFLLIIN